MIISRWSSKWDKKDRNGDSNQIMSDFIHNREFVVYAQLVKPKLSRDFIMSVILEFYP